MADSTTNKTHTSHAKRVYIPADIRALGNQGNVIAQTIRAHYRNQTANNKRG